MSRVRIKLCGMTRQQDILKAASLGVDAVGLIFAKESPRSVDIDEAKLLVKQIPAFLNVVGVFVNPDVAFVQAVLNEIHLHYLQFHGDESPAFCSQFHWPYIKAIQADSRDAIESSVESFHQASGILLDTPSKGARGGTGQVFDWDIIPKVADIPFILAGGLDAENVARARLKNIYAVDVCSGVERSPGIKDSVKMEQFVTAVTQEKP